MVDSYLRESVSVWQKWALPGILQKVLGRQLVGFRFERPQTSGPEIGTTERQSLCHPLRD